MTLDHIPETPANGQEVPPDAMLVPVSKAELETEFASFADKTDAQEPEPDPKNWVAVNVTMDKPAIVPRDAIARLRGLPLYTLRGTQTEVDDHIKAFPNFKVANDARGREWWKAFTEGSTHILGYNMHEAAVTREGSDWRQIIEYESLRLGIGKPPSTPVKGQVLQGEQAMLAIQNAMGLGTMIQVPLWHSGIWITLRTPMDAALLNLERRIQEEKISLGRDTNGAIYSNNMVYVILHVYNFILEHVYSVTMDDYTPEKLSSILRVTDLQAIVHAMACAIYPSGYEHSQPCTIAPDRCQHVTKDWINLSKLFWTDRSRLTKKQIKHMANRVARYTIDDIKAYQEEGQIGDGKIVGFEGDVKFVLRVPTIAEYVESGSIWVQEIVNMVERTMGKELASTDRDEYISSQARLVTLRQYGHWIKRITMGESTVIDDADNLNEMLNRLSGSETLVEQFLANIKTYIDDSTMSLIALPAYKCPSCQGMMTDKESEHPNLIPMDALITFFTLRDHRLLRAKTK